MHYDALRSKKIYRPKMIVWWPVLYSSQMILLTEQKHLTMCFVSGMGQGTKMDEYLENFQVGIPRQ